MTLSMTAYARHEIRSEAGTLSWELRSVNHRYLELSLRMDEVFRPLEIDIRKIFTQKLARGKVEASLRYQPAQQTTSLKINTPLAQAVIAASEQLAGLSQQAAPLDTLRLLQWPGIAETEEVDSEQLGRQAMDCLQQALQDLIAGRQREGAALQQMIEQRCAQINDIAEQVRQRLPEILSAQRQKLQDRLAELQVSLEPDRLEQEIVLLAQKSDVAEELDRLQNHVKEVRHVMTRKEAIGRRLDFLMQELNREANTLGSKSIDTDTTRYSVDLKVLIEQMREQIQNIE